MKAREQPESATRGQELRQRNGGQELTRPSNTLAGRSHGRDPYLLALENAVVRDVLPLPEEVFKFHPARGSGTGQRSKGGASGGLSTFNSLRRALQTQNKRRKATSSKPRDQRQRCSVRINYTKARIRGHFAAHGRYLIRESAAESGSVFGTAGNNALADTLAAWQRAGDPRLWKMIVSPEFGDRINLRELTERLMARLEHDHRAQFEWAAVEHRNTDHPHVHIVLRAMDREGREIHFSRKYLGEVIRQHAQDLCTAQLGPRTMEDVARALRGEIRQFRYTSLDRSILRQLEIGEGRSGPGFDPHLGGHRATFPQEPLLESRLRFLADMGLVRPLAPREWLVPQNLDWQLKQMAKAADRQRMLIETGVAISDDKMPLRATQPSEIAGLRGRVLGHCEDESSGSAMMILEGTDGQVHFIPHDSRIQYARALGKLGPNHFVSLDSSGVHDLGEADQYLSSSAFRRSPPLATELASASHKWRGWLGRYLAGLPDSERVRQMAVREEVVHEPPEAEEGMER